MNLFRQYTIVGGMPQAVETYVKTKNLIKTDSVKRGIVSLYRQDVRKYAKNCKHVEAIFDNISASLSEKDMKFSPRVMRKKSVTRNYENDFPGWTTSW